MPEAPSNTYLEALEALQKETERLKREHTVRQARGEVAKSLKPVPDRAWFRANKIAIENQPRPNNFEQKLEEIKDLKKDSSDEEWQTVLYNLDDLIAGRLSYHEGLFQGWRVKDLEKLRDAIL